jgi:hypothetical protein
MEDPDRSSTLRTLQPDKGRRLHWVTLRFAGTLCVVPPPGAQEPEGESLAGDAALRPKGSRRLVLLGGMWFLDTCFQGKRTPDFRAGAVGARPLFLFRRRHFAARWTHCIG